MTVSMQGAAGAAGKSGAVPGLALLAGVGGIPSGSSEGGDFAALMGDVALPASGDALVDMQGAASIAAVPQAGLPVTDGDAAGGKADDMGENTPDGVRSGKAAGKKTAKVRNMVETSIPAVVVSTPLPQPVAEAPETRPDSTAKEIGVVDGSGRARRTAATASPKAVPEAALDISRRSDSENSDDPIAPAQPAAEASAPIKSGEATALLSIAKKQAEARTRALVNSSDTTTKKRSETSISDVKNASQNTVKKENNQDNMRPQGKGRDGSQMTVRPAVAQAVAETRTVQIVESDETPPKSQPAPASKQVSAAAMAAAQSSALPAKLAAPARGPMDGDINLPAEDMIEAVPANSDMPGLKLDAPDAQRADTPRPALVSVPTAPFVTGGALGVPQSASVAGALGQQVVDMGVSGQWIEDISRQIVSIAANPGHGSFRIASAALGAVQVAITPGDNGSDVLMKVDNEAAHAALSGDSDRLFQDARLASVRIGDVRIERVSAPAEAQRGDMSSGQQQGGNGQSAAHAAMGQGAGQSGHQGGRADPSAFANQQQGGNNAKAPFTRTVLNDSTAFEQAGPSRGSRADTARYA